MRRFKPIGPEELNELLQLYMDIGNLNTEQKSKFGFIFSLNPNGEYTVNLMNKLLKSKPNLYKGVTIWWSKMIPLKVRCFIWRVVSGRIVMTETLAIRGINTSSTLCSICNTKTETVDHHYCGYSRVESGVTLDIQMVWY